MFALGPTVKFVLLYNCERREKDVKKFTQRSKWGSTDKIRIVKPSFRGNCKKIEDYKTIVFLFFVDW